MKVVIVAKTKIGSSACIGALTMPDGESLRLKDASGNFFPATTPLTIGDILDVTFTRPAAREPHHEDVVVSKFMPQGAHAGLRSFILSVEDPWKGGVEELFDGNLKFTSNNSGYIDASCVPGRSTGFWIPETDLQLTTKGVKQYYSAGGRDISYVGFEDPLDVIPAGTLVRVSLARWWKPADADEDFPERCYLQLSGWY